MTKIVIVKAHGGSFYTMYADGPLQSYDRYDIPEVLKNNTVLFGERKNGGLERFRFRPLDGTEWQWFRNNEPEKIVQAPGSGFRE